MVRHYAQGGLYVTDVPVHNKRAAKNRYRLHAHGYPLCNPLHAAWPTTTNRHHVNCLKCLQFLDKWVLQADHADKTTN